MILHTIFYTITIRSLPCVFCERMYNRKCIFSSQKRRKNAISYKWILHYYGNYKYTKNRTIRELKNFSNNYAWHVHFKHQIELKLSINEFTDNFSREPTVTYIGHIVLLVYWEDFELNRFANGKCRGHKYWRN